MQPFTRAALHSYQAESESESESETKKVQARAQEEEEEERFIHTREEAEGGVKKGRRGTGREQAVAMEGGVICEEEGGWDTVG